MMDTEQMWDELHHTHGISEETLQIVTSINGYSRETLLDVLFVTTGYRNFDQTEIDDDEENQ